MKKLLLFLFIVCAITLVNAQEELPTLFDFSEPVIKLKSNTKSKNNKTTNRINNPINLEVRKLKFQSMNQIANYSKNSNKNLGYFKIKIPKRRKKKGYTTVTAIPKLIEAEENGNYKYVAELVRGKNTKGSLILTYENGKHYGSMTIGKRSFTIEADKKEGELLLELDDRIINNNNACATDFIKPKGRKTSQNKISLIEKKSATTNSSRQVRVLVCYTDNANNVSNPAQLSSTLMLELNNSLRNSNINYSQLNFKLIGTRRINFNDRGNPLVILENAVQNNQINQLRNSLGADLVVVLTDGNYAIGNGTVLGIATLDEYTFSDTS